MTSKTKRLLRQIAFTVVALICWLAFGYGVLLSLVMKDVGNNASGDDYTGVAVGFGELVLLLSLIPLGLAIVFSVLSVYSLLHKKLQNNG